MLDFIRQEFPKAKIVYKPGNHEYRLPRYYASKAPEFIGSPLAAMESLIDFESRGIEFLDYYQKVKAGKLSILHGHEFGGLTTAFQSIKKAIGLEDIEKSAKVAIRFLQNLWGESKPKSRRVPAAAQCVQACAAAKMRSTPSATAAHELRLQRACGNQCRNARRR